MRVNVQIVNFKSYIATYMHKFLGRIFVPLYKYRTLNYSVFSYLVFLIFSTCLHLIDNYLVVVVIVPSFIRWNACKSFHEAFTNFKFLVSTYKHLLETNTQYADYENHLTKQLLVSKIALNLYKNVVKFVKISKIRRRNHANESYGRSVKSHLCDECDDKQYYNL